MHFDRVLRSDVNTDGISDNVDQDKNYIKGQRESVDDKKRLVVSQRIPWYPLVEFWILEYSIKTASTA